MRHYERFSKVIWIFRTDSDNDELGIAGANIYNAYCHFQSRLKTSSVIPDAAISASNAYAHVYGHWLGPERSVQLYFLYSRALDLFHRQIVLLPDSYAGMSVCDLGFHLGEDVFPGTDGPSFPIRHH